MKIVKKVKQSVCFLITFLLSRGALAAIPTAPSNEQINNNRDALGSIWVIIQGEVGPLIIYGGMLLLSGSGIFILIKALMDAMKTGEWGHFVKYAFIAGAAITIGVVFAVYGTSVYTETKVGV